MFERERERGGEREREGGRGGEGERERIRPQICQKLFTTHTK